MAVKVIRDILLATPAVVALVGDRVSPLTFAPNTMLPCVVLTRVSLTPSNHLHGRPSLDENRVQLDVFAETYEQGLRLQTDHEASRLLPAGQIQAVIASLASGEPKQSRHPSSAAAWHTRRDRHVVTPPA